MLAEHDSYYSQNDVINLINNNIHQNIPLMTIYSIMEEKNVLILLVVCHSYQINVSIVATKARKSIHFHRLIQFSSVQSLSRVWLFAIPWVAARQTSLSITNSRNLLKPMSIELVIPSNHLLLCCPLLLLPPIPPSIRAFANESTLHMRWPKYWSFSFSISPSNDRLISKYTHRLISMSIFSNESIISNECMY